MAKSQNSDPGIPRQAAIACIALAGLVLFVSLSIEGAALRLWAQSAQAPTPAPAVIPPSPDPKFPSVPSWKTELKELAPNVFMRVLMRETKKRFDAGMSPGQAAADIRLGKFDNWIGPQQIVMNVVRLYHHFNGTIVPDVDRDGMLKATLEYNAIKSKDR